MHAHPTQATLNTTKKQEMKNRDLFAALCNVRETDPKFAKKHFLKLFGTIENFQGLVYPASDELKQAKDILNFED